MASFIAYVVVLIALAVIVRLLTRNTFAAVMSGLVPGLGLVLAYGLAGSSFAGSFPAVMKQLSLFDRFYVFSNGVFDIRALVFFGVHCDGIPVPERAIHGEAEVERMKKLNLKGFVKKNFSSLKSSSVKIGGYSVFAVPHRDRHRGGRELFRQRAALHRKPSWI